VKKEVEIKYPHSKSLFNFCRRVLDHKYGGIRVIDQDVGSILGFDPADCSHWKKGKKNIRSIQAMKSIAKHLGVDERLVVDVASGELDDSEAYYEFNGYGYFRVDDKILESAKKDFYRKHASTWTRDKEQEFRARFDVNEPRIAAVIKEIHQKINFSEAPLYLPEVAASYPKLRLTPVQMADDVADAESVNVVANGDVTEIKYKAGREARPYMRFRLAKEIGRFFLKENGLLPAADLGEHAVHITEVQMNLFAAKLLTPVELIRKEMTQINVSKDIVSQLAEVFWVSKTFMNVRLKDILQSSEAVV
jgi:hypothetical protein